MALRIERVLITDSVDKCCVEILKRHGIEVVHGVKYTPEQLSNDIKNYDGLIVRSETKVTAQILESGKAGRLRVVGRAGTGVDNIDVGAATKLGIYVLNTPGGNSLSACELTCAMISSVARSVGGGVTSMKDGKWDRKKFMGTELFGKTLAVVGLGRIGREVAHRMKSYGMTVIGFDPLVSQKQAEEIGVQLYSDLDKIWPLADYITVHVPLNQHTKDMINASVFARCKPGVKIVNVARGGIVNEIDLLVALEDGRCGGAGMDVFSEEPPKSQHLWDLIKHPNVTATPHLGASTIEAQLRVAEEIAEQFVALAQPESKFKVCGAVNSDALSALTDQSNAGMVSLARGFGSMASSLSPVLSELVGLHVHSKGGAEKRWVTTCVIEGIVGQTGPGCRELATSKGLNDIQYSHTVDDRAEEVLEVKVIKKSGIEHSFVGKSTGSIGVLMEVEGTKFHPGFALGSRPVLLPTKDIAKTMQRIITDSDHVTGISVARSGDVEWICVNH